MIELLTIIAIMGTMVAVGVISWQRGKSRSQLVGATRDIMAVIRQARSIALVTQKPAIITFETVQDDEDEPYAKITVETAKLFDDTDSNAPIYTLDGTRVGEDQNAKVADAPVQSAESDGEAVATADEGESLNDVLMPKISRDIVKGICVQVIKDDEQLITSPNRQTYKSSISVFSTVGGARLALGNSTAAPTATDAAVPDAEATDSGPVEIVWGTNGRAEGHTVWVYPSGLKPEQGLSIVVDKFGACKVSQWEEEER